MKETGIYSKNFHSQSARYCLKRKKKSNFKQKPYYVSYCPPKTSPVCFSRKVCLYATSYTSKNYKYKQMYSNILAYIAIVEENKGHRSGNTTQQCWVGGRGRVKDVLCFIAAHSLRNRWWGCKRYCLIGLWKGEGREIGMITNLYIPLMIYNS